MSETVTKKDILLISVGGSPAPVIYSIEQHRPEAVIWFCSRDSRRQIRSAIEPELTHAIRDAEIITTPDEQSLYLSVRELARELPRALQNLGGGFDRLQADFTGGTKAMSAAVVLALADRGCPYSYVGGVSRDKEGLGVVLNGREQLLYCDNPWDALGREPLKLFALHFNRCRFSSAVDVARGAAARSDRLKVLFETLATLAEAYRHWDHFNHQQAANLLNRCRQALQTLPHLADGQAISSVFAATLVDNVERLERVKNDLLTLEGKSKQPGDGLALLLDLLANAVRRAEREHKYDDAVARLYSVIEKAAKIRLLLAHGIDNAAVRAEQVPEAAREEVFAGIDADEDGRRKLPLYRSYALLDALGDPLGATFRRRESDVRKVLDVRNHSLLAHGFNPVSESTYARLFEVALDFCEVDRASLPAFPELPES